MVDPCNAQAPAPGRKPVDAAAVAHQPAPGTAIPGAFGFSHDGRSLTFLKSESNSLTRVLWKVDLAEGSTPQVIARPPGGGDTETNISQAEALRRERQRQRDTGITQVVRAAKADVAIIPLGGDLYVLRNHTGSLERLTNTPSPDIDPQLSADGSIVVFVRDSELFALDLRTKKVTQLTTGARDGLTHGLAEFIAQEELDRSSGFWIAPDASQVVYQQTDERHIPLYTITHQGSSEYSTEAHRYPFTGQANARVRLGVVPIDGGMTRWLTLADGAEEFYIARVQWEDAKHLLVQLLSRDQKQLRLVRLDVDKNQRTTLIEDRSDTWINLHDDLRVVEKTGELLWSSERTGYRHLELHDRDGKLLRVLTAGDWQIDGPSSNRGYQGVAAIDSKRREVWFWATKDSPLETHLYRVSLDGGEIERVTQQRGSHRTIVAADCEHYIDAFSSLRRPPITTLRDRSGKVLITLDDASHDPRVGEYRLIAPELTEFKSHDGTVLYGAYYAPRSQSMGPRAPLVVIAYGGPQFQLVSRTWTLTADLTAQFLAERGFAVWKMDNRGSSRRGHAFEAGLDRSMGSIEVRDQADGVRFVAASRPEVDTSRVGITGASYGGYLTLRCLTEAPDVFHAGVSIAPVTAWDGYDTGYTERYMGTPQNNPEGYKAASVLTHASRLEGKLLVIHGMLDENVHFRHTARLATALIEAGKPFELLPLPDERHSTRREPDRQYMAERLATFFEAALGPKPANP